MSQPTGSRDVMSDGGHRGRGRTSVLAVTINAYGHSNGISSTN